MTTADETRLRRLTILSLPPQIGFLVLVCLLRGSGPAPPANLFVSLSVLALIGEFCCLRIGSLWVGVAAPMWTLTATIAGLVPAVCLTFVCPLVDLLRRRELPWWATAGNCCSSAMFALAAGVTFGLASDAGWAEPGTGSLALWVFIASIAGAVANVVATLPFAVLRGARLPDLLRESVLPAIPIEVSGAAIAAATAHAYYTIGFEAIGGLAVVIAMLAWLLGIVSRNERRREELATVEQRERERLAAGLHDDALQRLVLLRQDLAEGVDRYALEGGIDAIEHSLRDLLSKMGSFGTSRPVGPQLEELVGIIGERSGLRVDVELEPLAAARIDDDLVACIRELLLNVEKHAGATHASLVVTEVEGGVIAEVSDDGCGDQIDISDAINRGHVGLAIVSMRAAERGGQLVHRPRDGGGLVARVDLR